MMPPLEALAAPSRPERPQQLACIRLGAFSLVQGELIWEDGALACIRHASGRVVGLRVETLRRAAKH